MEPWLIVVISVVCASVLAVIAAGLSLAIVVDKFMFGKRQDKNAMFRYFTAEDFNLRGEDFPVYYDGYELSGKLFYDGNLEEKGTLVIFVHGFGAGSASYTTEIASLVRRGYAVLAYDAYGCNNSDGSGIKGFYCGVECAVAACIEVRRDKRLSSKKLVLVGHSWGAYSALCASAQIEVDKVVAISAFNSPVRAEADVLKSVSGRRGRLLAVLVCPWFALINLFRFGIRGNAKASNAVKRSRVKTFAIHGERDTTVPYSSSAAYALRGSDAKLLVLADKGHNPYNTVRAEGLLSALLTTYFSDEKSMKAFYADFDWSAATEEDGEVMNEIFAFIEGQ